VQKFIEYRFGPIWADISPCGRYISRYPRWDIWYIGWYSYIFGYYYYFLLERSFYFTLCDCGISM